MFAGGSFLDSPLVKTFLYIFLEKNAWSLLSFSLLKDGHFALYDEFNSFWFFFHLKESTSTKDGQTNISYQLKILKLEQNWTEMFQLLTYGIVQYFFSVTNLMKVWL